VGRRHGEPPDRIDGAHRTQLLSFRGVELRAVAVFDWA